MPCKHFGLKFTTPANANMRTNIFNPKEKLVPADNTENTSVLDGIQQPNENERKSYKMLKLPSIDSNAPCVCVFARCAKSSRSEWELWNWIVWIFRWMLLLLLLACIAQPKQVYAIGLDESLPPPLLLLLLQLLMLLCWIAHNGKQETSAKINLKSANGCSIQ